MSSDFIVDYSELLAIIQYPSHSTASVATLRESTTGYSQCAPQSQARVK
jgi:hypothetical protein